MGIDGYVCLKQKDFKLQGQFYSNNFSYIEIRLFKCANSPSCAPSSEIDSYFRKKRFNVAFVNHFFDIKDFGRNPVKNFIDDSLFWHIETDR